MTITQVKERLQELKTTFAPGKFWNHDPSQSTYSLDTVRTVPCDHVTYGTAGCNSYFQGNSEFGQCYAFALYMAERVFGASPVIMTNEPTNGTNFMNGWKAYGVGYRDWITLEPGDVIRMNGHSAIVCNVSGNNVEVAEVWGNPENPAYNCMIAWGNFNDSAYYTASTILSLAQYIVKAPTDKVTVTFDPGVGTCSITSKEVAVDGVYGPLPIPTRAGRTFMGWWDTSTNTECISSTTVAKSTAHTLTAIWGKTYKLTNVASGKCLNINGDNLTSLSPWDNVTLWSDSGSNEQKWILSTDYDNKPIKSVIDRNYGLNIYLDSTYNCNVFVVAGNEMDAAVYFTNYGSYYRVGLHNYNRYLTAAGTGDGANVYWATYTESNLQKWVLTEL